jgi:hypothetical protein
MVELPFDDPGHASGNTFREPGVQKGLSGIDADGFPLLANLSAIRRKFSAPETRLRAEKLCISPF